MTKQLTPSQVDQAVRNELVAVYEEVMWLAARQKVKPSMARAWYTHVVAEKFKRRIRTFSGKVSQRVLDDPKAILRLEHPARIQTKLTQLVSNHLKRKRPQPLAFVRLILECENVHIVTFKENYLAMQNDGNYRRAGIKLIAWRSIPEKTRRILWTKMLRGKVSNAKSFAPE